MRLFRLLLPALLVCGGFARAADIQVLSAGAVEPGIVAIAERFLKETGESVAIRFATAPALRQRLAEGETADVLIAPPPVIDAAAEAGKLDRRQQVPLGRVGVGIGVREGSPRPDISSVAALEKALVAADSIVFNEASTGRHVEAVLQRLNLLDRLAGKTHRVPSGTEVIARLARDNGREIGFGAITGLRMAREDGVVLVGPLPAEIQNYTVYVAAPLLNALARPEVGTFMGFLREKAPAIMTENGIEP